MIMSFAFRTRVHPKMVPYTYVKIIKFKQTEVTASKMVCSCWAGSCLLNCGEAEAHGGKSCWQGPVARFSGRMEDACVLHPGSREN